MFENSKKLRGEKLVVHLTEPVVPLGQMVADELKHVGIELFAVLPENKGKDVVTLMSNVNSSRNYKIEQKSKLQIIICFKKIFFV